MGSPRPDYFWQTARILDWRPNEEQVEYQKIQDKLNMKNGQLPMSKRTAIEYRRWLATVNKDYYYEGLFEIGGKPKE